MALHRWNAWNPAYGRCFRPGARDGVFGTTFRGPESPPAALSESETGYRADHSTVCGASHDTFRRQRFLGVGGSGRSPLESADPLVRRAGALRKNGSKRTVYSKNSLVKYSRGRGAGAENRSPRSPREVRFAAAGSLGSHFWAFPARTGANKVTSSRFRVQKWCK